MIVYASSFDVSRPDGPGVNEQQFVRSMARLYGDDVLFVIPRPIGTLPAEFPHSRCRYLPAVRGRRALQWLRHNWAKYLELRAVERELRPALYILRPDVFPLVEWLVTRGGRIRYCVKNAHLSARERLLTPGLRGLLFRLHYALLERVLEGAAGIDVVSEIHRRELLQTLALPPERVTVTDNAVDHGLFCPMDKRRCRQSLRLERFDPLFGYIGNLAATRGGAELIRALAILTTRLPRAGVLIVEGDGRSTGQLRDLAASLRVDDRVVLAGPVPLPDVARHIGALDVAASFRDDDGCSELKVRQYIACGRPVVVSAMVNRFVEPAGLGSVVDRRDTAAIADALQRWAGAVATPAQTEVVARRLSRYARDHLDTDAANRRRIGAWLAAESA